MAEIIGVRFKSVGKVYYFDPGSIPLEKDDQVIVETSRGTECGLVVLGPKTIPDEDLTKLKTVADAMRYIEENQK